MIDLPGPIIPQRQGKSYLPYLFPLIYNVHVKNLAIILAGGSGERLHGPVPKQFLQIAGRPLLGLCLERFQSHPGIEGIVLVAPSAHLELAEKTVSAGRFSKVIRILAGGNTRQESSFIGVSAAPAGVKNVLIHDAARALVAAGVITRVLEALAGMGAVMAALPAADTVVRVDDAAMITAVLDRGMIGLAQTPQGFKLDIIRRAHEMARQQGVTDASDDCSLVLHSKLAPVASVPGDRANIKITYPQDIAIAEAILRNP
jgi:2-C-methyl-D-erythritol 4-phosphate cytidylyltransferase